MQALKRDKDIEELAKKDKPICMEESVATKESASAEETQPVINMFLNPLRLRMRVRVHTFLLLSLWGPKMYFHSFPLTLNPNCKPKFIVDLVLRNVPTKDNFLLNYPY